MLQNVSGKLEFFTIYSTKKKLTKLSPITHYLEQTHPSIKPFIRENYISMQSKNEFKTNITKEEFQE